MTSPLTGQSILVTGGAGFFGRAFVQHALDSGARRVAVFSRDEVKHAAMAADFPDDRLRFMLGDVRDENRVMDAMRGVDVCVHASAQKRIEQCEYDPFESVSTNIIGTANVARACVERGVKRAAFLSTDKSAAPNTTYGACKLAAERLWCRWNVYAAGTGTVFAATRYGNVTFSTGSVLPLWREQARTGTLTITDVRMSRFLMSIDQAVGLVDLALREMRGGEVFIPRVKCANMSTLASVLHPGVAQREIGIRPGEKIYETLVTEDEARTCYDCGTHFVLDPVRRSWGDAIPPHGIRVPDGFTYRSDTGVQMSRAEMLSLGGN